MPWCESCAEVVTEDAARTDDEGVTHCPNCDGPVSEESEEERPAHAPWHFKLLAVGTVIYLIYRLIWFIFWLRQHG